jgi:hypothetical protein
LQKGDLQTEVAFFILRPTFSALVMWSGHSCPLLSILTFDFELINRKSKAAGRSARST